MEAKRASKLIKEIINEGSVEAGVFMSLLAYTYLQTYDLTQEKLLKSLENSLEKMKSDEDEKK